MSSPSKPRSPQHPNHSSYGKYKCQYKNKSILTKLNNDSGYPQQILQLDDTTSKQPQNFISANKKNLRNFFKQRIPAQNNLLSKLMKREAEMIHPKRIFQMKQIQYELKSKTKVSLKQSFEIAAAVLPPSTEKVNANFHVNDKNKQLKEKYGGTARLSNSLYDEHQFRRGTHSHIQKRSKILKKQAYDRVFGPDPSSLSRTAVFSKNSSPIKTKIPHRAKSISVSSPFEQTNQHKHLRELIVRMNEYKNKLQDRNQICELGVYDEFNSRVNQDGMITLIQNMAKMYQGRTIDHNHQKIENLQDLSKINGQFYSEMLQHKNNRLSRRKQFINKTIHLTNGSQTLPVVPTHKTHRFDPANHSQISMNDFEERSDSLDNVIESKQTIHHSVKFRFALLKKTLVRWAALFYIYGIQKNDIFVAFKNKEDPYQLEGSYAFFKCIKMGQLASVKTFLEKNRNYAFQIQFYGKSALSYACSYNQTQIAKEILKIGVNSDQVCNNGKTSLFYALSKQNIQIVRQILQMGASPWSTIDNPYGEMILHGQNRQQLQNLINNARKVYLGMQIQSTIVRRKQYWQKNHLKIVQNRRLSYQTALL